MLFASLCVSLLAICSALIVSGAPWNFTEDNGMLSAMSDEVARKFSKEYTAYLKTGIESPVLRQISNEMASTHSQKDIFTKNIGDLRAVDQFVVCTTCRATLSVLGDMFRDPEGELNGESAKENSKKVMLDICDRFNLQTEEVCSGLFELNWPVLDYIIQNTVADTRSLCGTLPIHFCKVRQEEYNFTLSIDASGSVIDGPKSDIPAKSSDDLKILHLTDIHYDPEYEPGALADCPEPMCCQRSSLSGVVESSKQAGYWGDYRDCDAPLHVVEHAFDHIVDTHSNIDYIYQTGDVVPHIPWATTQTGNMDIMTKINQLIMEKFTGIPVYPNVGNHESHPSNVFGAIDTPDEINVKWLYEHLWSLWSTWLPAEAENTVLKGGYYTASPKSGFRVISLNNNDCYLYNWWIYLNGSIAIEQLEWLHDTLLAAEKAGEYVHILAHIPSGDVDCWTVWAREYNRVIERFSHIIGGIFNGHTHVDELNVHYTSKGHAVAVSWNGGSLTTYSNKNSNYVVYEVEPKSLQVVDYETWIFDLEKANELGQSAKPQWFKEYSLSEFTEDLSPNGLDGLLDRLARNPELLRKYWQYKYTSAKPHLDVGCDDGCLSKTICRMAVTVYDQKKRCKELQEILKENLPTETTESSTTEILTTEGPSTTEDPSGDSAVMISATQLTTMASFFVVARLIF
ncbi:sphingomyelin phosphodiesterase 1 [Anastrepha obliqua]|uniref:sphingomyelin phosphodiesterase 1 n=1 Tax=Anastrepha obliqua TaxID=95512 RepID=UPI002409187D|nr:sphingomyelin phosphodiesterase 1 [Anastrepha obliqua]